MSEAAPTPIGTLIDAVVDEHDDELVALRRDLHAHPELSWRELRTTALVAGPAPAGRLAAHRAAAAPAWSPTSATAGRSSPCAPTSTPCRSPT